MLKLRSRACAPARARAREFCISRGQVMEQNNCPSIWLSFRRRSYGSSTTTSTSTIPLAQGMVRGKSGQRADVEARWSGPRKNDMEPSSWQIQNSAAPAWLRLRRVSTFFMEPQRPPGTIVKRVDPFVHDASGVLGVLVAFSAFPGVLGVPGRSRRSRAFLTQLARSRNTGSQVPSWFPDRRGYDHRR